VKISGITPEQPPDPGSAAAPVAKAVGLRGHRIRDAARAQERRREILMGAARAFARSGYYATNMEQIASECGLAKGHIYHYFPSKEDIFTEIRIDAISRAIEQVSTIASARGDDPEHALRTAIAGLIARVFERGGRYEPVLSDPVSLSPANRKRIRTLSRRYEQIFASILQSGIERSVFVHGDPKLTTFVILRAANTVASWYREGGKWKPQWIVKEVTDQLVRSVKAR
jgi:AcrR family transcriptional regulator